MKKEVILETAARLFAKHGYARTSTVVLAQEAGVAEGTIFRHFKSKEELFITLVVRLRHKIVKDVYQDMERYDSETGLERLLVVIKAVYAFVRKNSADFALLLRDAPGCYGELDSKAFEHVQGLFLLLEENFQKYMEIGQAEGNIRKELDSKDTSCILSSSLVGLMRTVHLGFLKPSENILDNYISCTRAMLEEHKA